MSESTSTASSPIKTFEETAGLERLILLEQYRFFDQLIDGMSKHFKETIDAVASLLESSAGSFRRIRVSAITGVGSIFIPPLLALASLDSTHTIVNTAITLSAFFIIVAGVLTFWTTMKISSLENRTRKMQQEFSVASVALSFVQHYVRSSAALTDINQSDLKELYRFYYLLQSAIRHWIIHIAGTDWLRLDEPTRRVFETQARYCVDKKQDFRTMVDKPFVKKWQEDFPAVDKILQEYKQWCRDICQVSVRG